MLIIQHLRSAFRNLAGRWDTARVPSHRGGTGCSAIRGTSSRRRCGGPLRAAESACRLRSLRGTQPPRFSAALRIFSAMILCMLTHRTISTAYVTRLRQYRSAGARTSARPTVNALRLPRAAKPRTDTSRALIRVDFSISRQRIDAGVIPARTGKGSRRDRQPDRVKCGKPKPAALASPALIPPPGHGRRRHWAALNDHR